MKKNLFVFLSLAAVTAAASTAYGAYSKAGTGITGSRHDINAFAREQPEAGMSVTTDEQERVCAFCHTPHHAYLASDANVPDTADYLPLWSHQITNKNYTPYASSTLQANLNGNNDPLIGPSRLCMSCHDGVVAIDTHYTNPGTTSQTSAQLSGDLFSAKASESGAVGKNGDLAGDHPIGFDYIRAQADDATQNGNLAAGIRPATNSFRTLHGGDRSIKIQDVLYPTTKSGAKTIMTCCTCHEVHNRDNVVQLRSDNSEMSVNYFLYSYQSGSQICLSCHDK